MLPANDLGQLRVRKEVVTEAVEIRSQVESFAWRERDSSESCKLHVHVADDCPLLATGPLRNYSTAHTSAENMGTASDEVNLRRNFAVFLAN